MEQDENCIKAEEPTTVPDSQKMEFIKLDHQGDVILRADRKDFLCSSKVLSIASPVFRVMFGSLFSEASKVSQSRPGKISLTDDEPEALSTLLSIFHHRLDRLPAITCAGPIDESESRHLSIMAGNLTQLADKYDTMQAITPWASTLVTLLAESKSIFVGDVLYAAWKLGAPEAFEKLTKRLVLAPGDPKLYSGAFSTESSIGPTSLPEGLHGECWSHYCPVPADDLVKDALAKKGTYAKREFYEEVEKRCWLLALGVPGGPEWPNHKGGCECCEDFAMDDPIACGSAFSHIISWLYSHDVLPVSVGLKRTSVATALDTLKDCHHGPMDCSECSDQAIKDLQRVEQKWRALRGFCLDCVKSNDKVASGCKIQHEGFLGLSATKPFENKMNGSSTTKGQPSGAKKG